MFFSLFKTSLLSLSLVWFCDGYTQGCKRNMTIYAEKGSDVAFVAEDLRVSHRLEFSNTSQGDSYIFTVNNHFHTNLLRVVFSERLRFSSQSLKERTEISVTGARNLTIVLKEIKTSDNGTYVLRPDIGLNICWTLFVISVDMENQTRFIGEGTSIRFKGNPASTLLEARSINATVVWLLDGIDDNETDNFHVSGDMLWIPRVTREQDGTNITYRVIYGEDVKEVNLTLHVIYIQTDKGKGPVEEGFPLSFKVNRPILEGGIDQEITASWTYDGRHIKETNHFLVYGDLIMIPKVTLELNGKNVTYKMEDNDGGVLLLVNLTLQVHYGPSWPLQLIPPKTAYFLTQGDILPEISCDVDCNPACNTSWGDYGSGRKLNLGEVATDDTGEYVCTAYRNGSNLVIHRSVYVYVQDMSSSTVILGGLLALNTLALTCIIVCMCCRRCGRCKTLPTCLMRFKVRGEVPHKELHNTGVIAAQGHRVAPDKRTNYEEFSTGSELATYTDLEQDNSAYANTEIEPSVKRIV